VLPVSGLVRVTTAVGVGVAVGATVGTTVAVGVTVGATVGTGVGIGVGTGVGVMDGVGVAFFRRLETTTLVDAAPTNSRLDRDAELSLCVRNTCARPLAGLGANARTVILWRPSCSFSVSHMMLVFGETDVKCRPPINTFNRTTLLLADTVIGTDPLMVLAS
jgi:hypothetical protein